MTPFFKKFFRIFSTTRFLFFLSLEPYSPRYFTCQRQDNSTSCKLNMDWWSLGKRWLNFAQPLEVQCNAYIAICTFFFHSLCYSADFNFPSRCRSWLYPDILNMYVAPSIFPSTTKAIFHNILLVASGRMLSYCSSMSEVLFPYGEMSRHRARCAADTDVDEEPDISEAQAWGQLSKMLSEKYADQHHVFMYFFLRS